ncbi:MAG: hypothetical protein Q8L04_04255 [Ignavibacteria bacterium]|nr:hypothetical protein [Ignavibacteria bacterium]
MKTKVILFLICLATPSLAQTLIDTTYSIELNLSFSPSINVFRNPKYPGDNDKKTWGYGFFASVMWHPGRMLSLGILSGYTLFSHEHGIGDSGVENSATLYAIPVQIAISMQRLETEMGLGIGPYFMKSELDDGINTTTGFRMEYGITFWITYSFGLTELIKIAPELRYLYLGYRGINSYMTSINLKYYLFRY